MIPPVRVMRDGVVNDEVVRIYQRNSRFPEMMKGDLNAIMAACKLGKQRLQETIARYGGGTVEAAFAEMLRQTEAALRRADRCAYSRGPLAIPRPDRFRCGDGQRVSRRGADSRRRPGS